MKIKSVSYLLALTLLVSCTSLEREAHDVLINSIESEKTHIAKEMSNTKFKDHWYDGKAEISSYKLSQARYGEVHEGSAVLIYVTEEFDEKKQVKADQYKGSNIPVMKMNATKKYLTGIYPYSLMTSNFTSLKNNQAVKSTFSAQEWCGQTYVQLNNKKQFEIESHSYFDTNSDHSYTLKKDVLETDLWNIIRFDPEQLPIGNLSLIPSMEYLMLWHQEVKSYEASASKSNHGDLTHYTIKYPSLGRSLTIKFQTAFPHQIEAWESTYPNIFYPSGGLLKTEATKINSIRTDYWSKNRAGDRKYREQLGLSTD